MNDVRDINAEAKGMLVIAVRRMVAAYPFHANLLSAGRFEADPAVLTMGVTVRQGRLTFCYAPRFIVACSFAELSGLLHHTINHVLFGDLFDDPSKFPNEEARIVAQEVTANEFVREPLPGRPLTLDQYPQLPPDEATATRYCRLVDAAQKHGQKGLKSSQSGPKNGPVGPKNGPAGPKNGPAGPRNGPPARKNGRSPTKSGTDRTKKKSKVQPLDDHSIWVEARQNNSLNQLAVVVAVRRARQQLTADELNAMPASIRRQIDQVSAGSSAGAAVHDVRGGGSATIDWRRTLRRIVGRVLEIRPVFNRPPRRFPDLVGIVPGQGRRSGKPRIMAVIDTSASLNAAALREVCGELDRLGRSNDVLVVECDARIHAVYSYRGRIKRVRGRGGTDLRPVFAAEFLRRHRPDVVVYFTDGFGRAPSRRPGVPVIWCLTPDGRQPAAWGHTLRLSACEQI